MITVNLKDPYYWCKEDVFVEIKDAGKGKGVVAI